MTPDYFVKRVELNTGDENEYPHDTKSVPSQGAVKPTRDFKKVLSKSNKEGKDELATGKKKTPVKMFKEIDEEPKGEEIALLPSKDDEENAVDTASMSLFDLSKNTAKVKEPGGKVQAPPQKIQSTSDLLFKTASKKEPQSEKPIVAPQDKASKYTQEQPDLSYVNPLAAAAHPHAIVAPTQEPKVERAAPLTPAMQDLIEQIVKQMYTITDKDKTDTVMLLDHPPLFKEARVIITSFETARGQFNITFENLSQAAQRILDQEENRRTLLNALEQKGYNVQIFTTTTVMEPRINVDETLAQQGKQEDQGGQSKEQPRKRKRDEA